jgi:hypothetical protein
MKIGTVVALAVGVGLVVLVARGTSGNSTKFKVGDYIESIDYPAGVFKVTAVSVATYSVELMPLGSGSADWLITDIDPYFKKVTYP